MGERPDDLFNLEKAKKKRKDLIGDGKVPVSGWHQERMGGLWPGLPHRPCTMLQSDGFLWRCPCFWADAGT